MGKPHYNKLAPIIGAWKLISFEIKKENGEVIYPFGKVAKGSIIYTKSGHFSVHVMCQDRHKFSLGDQMKRNNEGC